ncbi:glycerophosphoryl diester phosphodiesterase [Palleronia aestuarii]|uniref:Glycerophosphoryl diester phosphodiesterase n=1 Tax=Palleronia aestuarii TaxID=568105 RepID=A0A2W7P640_9RHOB|nr:glycerophosphodiester phosphodiesterase family protein [Palleronia aestuarii]PZX18872.1 glycerophosphoryl diester phosphodiesterase [Palleronia aestuarii]
MRLPRGFLERPIAHRGLHDAAAGIPENSARAFEAAIASGYGIELDVRISRDGQAMVFHDATLDRLTAESGEVAERDAETLGRIAIGPRDRIETLDRTLARVAGRVPLLVELKDPTGHLGETDGRLEDAVARALSDYDGPAAVMSFNPNMISMMARRAPDVIRGLTTCAFDTDDWPGTEAARDRLRRIEAYDAVGAVFVSHDHRSLDMPRVSELARAGADVLCWTVRDTAEESEARRVADNITFEGYRPA